MKMGRKWLVLLVSLIVLLCAPGFYGLWYNGVFVSANSANVFMEGLEFDGKLYRGASGEHYTEGRTIGKDGNWKIKEIKEDPSHTFIVARSFLDQRLYVLEDYTIPTSGTVTKAYWNFKEITDESFLETISKLNAEKKTTFTFETEAIFQLTDHQKMRRIYLAYENCPIATVYEGYLGVVDGRWAITTNSEEMGLVECYEIPEKYVAALEPYFD